MNIDRKAFLAFASMIAAASAPACSADDAPPAASQDITSSTKEGGGACVSDGEQAYPYQEGTDCWDLYKKGIEDDYKNWTTVVEGGQTLAEKHGCQPASPSHPSVEGAGPVCETYSANFVSAKCLAYVDTFKKSNAADAVACLKRIPDLTDSMAIYTCGFDALDKACPFHPTAESACKELAPKLSGDAEMTDCMRQMSGLRDRGRQQVLEAAKDGPWYGLHSAIEGISR